MILGYDHLALIKTMYVRHYYNKDTAALMHNKLNKKSPTKEISS